MHAQKKRNQSARKNQQYIKKKITHYNSKDKTTRIEATNNQNSQKGYQNGKEEKRGKTETYGGGTVGRRIIGGLAAGWSGEIGHRRVSPKTSPGNRKKKGGIFSRFESMAWGASKCNRLPLKCTKQFFLGAPPPTFRRCTYRPVIANGNGNF